MAIAVLQQGHRHLQAALADQGGLQVIEELEGTDTALKALGAARDKALANNLEWLTEGWLLTVASLLEEGEGLTRELEHVSPVAHSSDVAALADGANETSSPVDFDSCHAKGKQPPGACRGFGEPSKAYENYRGLLPTISGGQRRGGRPNSGGFAVMGAARGQRTVCGQPGGSRDTVPRVAAEQPVRGSRDGHSQRGGGYTGGWTRESHSAR